MGRLSWALWSWERQALLLKAALGFPFHKHVSRSRTAALWGRAFTSRRGDFWPQGAGELEAQEQSMDVLTQLSASCVVGRAGSI